VVADVCPGVNNNHLRGFSPQENLAEIAFKLATVADDNIPLPAVAGGAVGMRFRLAYKISTGIGPPLEILVAYGTKVIAMGFSGKQLGFFISPYLISNYLC